jgi:hypothetical protein
VPCTVCHLLCAVLCDSMCCPCSLLCYRCVFVCCECSVLPLCCICVYACDAPCLCVVAHPPLPLASLARVSTWCITRNTEARCLACAFACDTHSDMLATHSCGRSLQATPKLVEPVCLHLLIPGICFRPK